MLPLIGYLDIKNHLTITGLFMNTPKVVHQLANSSVSDSDASGSFHVCWCRCLKI